MSQGCDHRLYAEIVDNRKCDASRPNALAAKLRFDQKHGCCNPGYADLLIIDGNHLKQLDVLKDESHMQLIMKDGKIF